MDVTVFGDRPAAGVSVILDNLKALAEYAVVLRDPAALARLDAEMDAWEAAI